MPQVQCGFWCQRLSPPLFGLKSVVHFFFVYISKIGLPRQAPRAVALPTPQTKKQTNTMGVDRIKTPHFCSLVKCALFAKKQQHNITEKTTTIISVNFF
jgi:hypothetical protein